MSCSPDTAEGTRKYATPERPLRHEVPGLHVFGEKLDEEDHMFCNCLSYCLSSWVLKGIGHPNGFSFVMFVVDGLI